MGVFLFRRFFFSKHKIINFYFSSNGGKSLYPTTTRSAREGGGVIFLQPYNQISQFFSHQLWFIIHRNVARDLLRFFPSLRGFKHDFSIAFFCIHQYSIFEFNLLFLGSRFPAIYFVMPYNNNLQSLFERCVGWKQAVYVVAISFTLLQKRRKRQRNIEKYRELKVV